MTVRVTERPRLQVSSITLLGIFPATSSVRVLEAKRAEPSRIWERNLSRLPTCPNIVMANISIRFIPDIWKKNMRVKAMARGSTVARCVHSLQLTLLLEGLEAALRLLSMAETSRVTL